MYLVSRAQQVSRIHRIPAAPRAIRESGYINRLNYAKNFFDDGLGFRISAYRSSTLQNKFAFHAELRMIVQKK